MTYQETLYPAKWVAQPSFVGVNPAPTLSTDGIAVPQNMRGKNLALRWKFNNVGYINYFAWMLWGYCPGELDSNGDLIAGSEGWTALTYKLSTDIWFSLLAAGNIDKVYMFNTLTAFDRLYFQCYENTVGTFTFYISFGFTDE